MKILDSLQDKFTKIKPLIDDFSGNISLAIRDLNTNELLTYQEKNVMPTASTIKVLILAHLLAEIENRKYSLTDMLEMKADQQERGTGILKDFTLGTKYMVKDVAMAMMVISDNTATNMLIDLLGGVEAVNEYIQSVGLKNTELIRRVDFKETGTDARGIAVSTTEDFTKFLTDVHEGKVFSEEMKEIFDDMMSRQQDLSQFPRYLPYNPYAEELNMEQEVYIANKTGTFPGVRCDVGYAKNDQRHVVFSVFTDESDDLAFNIDNENAILIGKIGKIIME